MIILNNIAGFEYRQSALSLLLLFSCCLFTNTVSAQDTFTVGIVPQFDSRKINAIWRPVLDKLQVETGYKFTLKGSPGISDFEHKFSRGDFDFAYMNPYHLLSAYKTQGYQPIARDVLQSLYGIVVVRADSPITTVKQLHNKVVAFPSANAMGASLMVRAELLDTHQVQVIPKYVSSHSSVYLNVALGQVIAGGGVQKTLGQQSDELKNHLRVLLRTGEVASHPISAHPRVPGEAQEKVRNALLEMGKTPHGQALLAKIPIKRLD